MLNSDILDGNRGDGLYITYNPSITEWAHGEVRERLVIPAGEITDFSSIPDRRLMGWLARKLGFDKSAPHFKRSGKIHDMLYFALKHWGGILPYGWHQFFNPTTQQWESVVAYKWNRQQADAIWKRISIEDGCPKKTASLGYRLLRMFGGIHMIFH